MVTKTLYQDLIREASMLLNARLLPAETEKLIFYKIEKDFEDVDLKRALEDIMRGEDKLGYLPLLARLNYHRSVRMESENAQQKRQEEEAARKFWKQEYTHIKQGNCNRKCDGCFVKSCDIIAKESIAAVRRMLSGQTTMDEEHLSLSGKFPNIGFERLVPGLQPF